MRKFIFLLVLILIALSERLFLDLGPNIELITAGILLSGFYLGQRWSMVFVMITMVISDIVLGNSSIYLFTWTGFLIPAIFAFKVFSRKQSIVNNSLRGVATGIGANLFFYLWTNFGVWALDSWGMYTNDLSGLIASYINALPFLRYQLTSTLAFVPLGFTITELVRRHINFGVVFPEPLQIRFRTLSK